MSPNDTIEDLQTQVYNKEGIPPDSQRMIWAGKRLCIKAKFIDYNIFKLNNSTIIHLINGIINPSQIHEIIDTRLYGINIEY